MTSNTTDHLRGVWGSSATDVYAVGQSGLYAGNIHHYDGTDWTQVDTGLGALGSNDYRGIWGTSASDIFVVGSLGAILHYGGAAPEPDISVSPLGNDFGDVIVGNSSAPLEVTISNTGTADLNVSGITLSDTTNYSLDVNGGSNPAGSTAPVILAGEDQTVTVTFSSASIGIFSANLTIDSDDPDSPSVSVSLTGDGISPPMPDAVILTADSANITADGTSTSTLTATVTDQYGDLVEDGTDVVFNTNHGTLGSSTVTKQTSVGVATANLTSESSTEIVIATVTATADSASDATAVFFLPEGVPGIELSETETVADSGTLADTPTGGDVSIDATGNHIITTAKYEGNPGGIPTFETSGNYYDVHLDNDINVNSLTIEFSPAIEDTTIFYWDGASWLPASDQYYDSIKECIVVTITASTFPSLSDLTGLIFGSGLAVIHVDIDIKPGSDPNSINLKSKGVVPMAVLTTGDFDASSIDPTTVRFADAQMVRWTLEDVDSDGDLDMLFHFKTQDLDLTQDSAEAILTGETNIGQSIEGTDTVRIVTRRSK
jgi:hypothetical protein